MVAIVWVARGRLFSTGRTIITLREAGAPLTGATGAAASVLMEMSG